MHPGWLIVAGLSGAASVVLGSFGSHGIAFAAGGREMWLLAERYHQVHTLALLGMALLPLARFRSLRAAAYAFALGILLFCVPVYLRAAGHEGPWAKLAPVGGTLLIGGWVLLAFGGWRSRRNAA
jgi:uncharacterized membrane protein YgdD (TMEM256/DUF423 family)